jgi:hypothetical protein
LLCLHSDVLADANGIVVVERSNKESQTKRPHHVGFFCQTPSRDGTTTRLPLELTCTTQLCQRGVLFLSPPEPTTTIATVQLHTLIELSRRHERDALVAEVVMRQIKFCFARRPHIEQIMVVVNQCRKFEEYNRSYAKVKDQFEAMRFLLHFDRDRKVIVEWQVHTDSKAALFRDPSLLFTHTRPHGIHRPLYRCTCLLSVTPHARPHAIQHQ